MPDLSVRQWEAWQLLEDKTHTEVLYGGGAGGGKSFLGALWLMAACLRYPGSRWLMGRAVLKTLKETTLNSFFDACSLSGLSAGEHYVYNAQTSQIAVGSSTIILKDLFSYPSDPNFDDLGSLEVTGAFLDEVNQISDRAKSIVASRIRYKLDEFGLVPKLLMSCNPARNWVYTDFYQPWRDGTLEPHRAFVPALVGDNPHISGHYIDNLGKLQGADRARLLLGDWDYDNDPQRLIDNDAIADMFSGEAQRGNRYISADVARYGSDRTVIMLWDGFLVEHVTTMDKSSVPEVAAAIISMARLERIPRSRIVIDDDGVGGGVADLVSGCVRFNGGSKPISARKDGVNYRNLKTQCYYELADHVNARMVEWKAGYEGDIRAELPWVKRAKVDHDGKLELLGKDKVKDGLGRSPDFADAMMMRMVFELRGEGSAARVMAAQGRKYRHEEAVKEIGRRFGVG